MLNEIVQAWFPVVATIAGICSTLGIYWVNSRIDAQVAAATAAINERTDDLLGAMEVRVGGHHDRLTQLEAHWDTLPSREDFHRMAIRMEGMAGDLKAINEKLTGLSDQVGAAQRSTQRINDYLLNDKASGK